MLFSRLLKGRRSTTIWVTLLACAGFLVGTIYMYRVPTGMIGQQLAAILLIFGGLIVIAFILAMVIVAIKKVFHRH